MRRIAQQLFKRTSGSVLIYTALAIFALAAIGVIGVDISRMLVTRVQLGNAADAGALAGVSLLSMDRDASELAVELRAREVASQNHAFAAEGAEEIPFENIDADADLEALPQVVQVTTNSDVSAYFTGVVGQALLQEVSAYAEAAFGPVTNVTCIKPWSIPDRHDDVTPIEGYPEWANNGMWDGEDFTDTDESGKWEPGEPYTDGNSNGTYDREFFHPLFTGYTASRDHGLQLSLKMPQGEQREPGQYWPIDLPDENGDRVTGADWYRWNIANCNPNPLGPGDWVWLEPGNMPGPTSQGMRQLYDLDPDAFWDTSCECIQDSEFAVSPRVGIIPLHDPQIPIASGKKQIQITKLAAFFIEDIRSNGRVTGRFMRLTAPSGEFCTDPSCADSFIFALRLTDTK